MAATAVAACEATHNQDYVYGDHYHVICKQKPHKNYNEVDQTRRARNQFFNRCQIFFYSLTMSFVFCALLSFSPLAYNQHFQSINYFNEKKN